MLVGREPAKMRPSKDLTTCGRVCAVSSWVVVGNGGLSTWIRWVLSGWSTGCPGLLPGTPGDPSRRAGSQGTAQQDTLPSLRRAVHVEGTGETGTTPRGSQRRIARVRAQA